MRLALIFPPPADPALPPGGVAALAAAVRAAGAADVRVHDLNVETFDALLRRQVLRTEVEACAKLQNTSGTIMPRVSKALIRAPEVLAHIEDAIASLRDPESFYDPARLFYAKRIFQFACELLSARFPLHAFGKYTYCNTDTELASFEQIERWVRMVGPLTRHLVDTAAPEILRDRPDVVGLSVCYSAQLVPAFILAETLKRLSPEVHVIMGGPIITWGKHILERDARFSTWIDSFCIGEGEEHLPRWLQALAGRQDRSTVKDIVYYDAGSVVSTTDPSYRLDLDGLPTPEFTDFPLRKYFAPSPIFCLTPARGCYYNKCSFCNYAYIKLATYRMRDPKLIAQDLDDISRRTGCTVFCLETDIFHPKHLSEMAKAFRERRLDIKWHGVAKVDPTMTQELFDELVSSGCVRLFIGLESGNDRVLDLMKKGTSVADADGVLSLCRCAGIHVEAGIIANYPSETEEELEDTYQFIVRNQDVLARPDIGGFRLLRGSPLAEDPTLVGLQIGVPDRSWHVIEHDHRADNAARLQSLATRTLVLFPEIAFIDVSEDILYHAAGLHTRLRDWSREETEAQADLGGHEQEFIAVSAVGNRQITVSLEAADDSVVSVIRVLVDRARQRLCYRPGDH